MIIRPEVIAVVIAMDKSKKGRIAITAQAINENMKRQ
jgi:hypothetical protein